MTKGTVISLYRHDLSEANKYKDLKHINIEDFPQYREEIEQADIVQFVQNIYTCKILKNRNSTEGVVIYTWV